jgi:hypothetical protein
MRKNRNSEPDQYSFGDFDTDDIGPNYFFMYVPSQGTTRYSTGAGVGGCSGGQGGKYSGIINVEGDVLVSGIVDGRVTIVANGNIILDHELEKEDYMQPVDDPDASGADNPYDTVGDIDMVGLFATGNIIVPNSRPKEVTHAWRGVYDDDWSDAENGQKAFVPTGQYDATELLGDNGTEDIHAVMVSFGAGPCTGHGNALTCNQDPTDADIREFKTGLYATARTEDGEPDGMPCCEENNVRFWSDQGNDSGTLRIYGALIQNIPGRVGYDYYSSNTFANSSCNGTSGKCKFIGHRMELVYDKHLRYTTPAFPIGVGGNGHVPYGKAAYEIVSWQEIDPALVFSGDNW